METWLVETAPRFAVVMLATAILFAWLGGNAGHWCRNTRSAASLQHRSGCVSHQTSARHPQGCLMSGAVTRRPRYSADNPISRSSCGAG